MRKPVAALVALALLLTGCGKVEQGVNVEGKRYPYYGIFNEAENRSKQVCYKIEPAVIIAAVILIETVIVPIVLVGYYLYTPYRLKQSNTDDCSRIES